MECLQKSKIEKIYPIKINKKTRKKEIKHSSQIVENSHI